MRDRYYRLTSPADLPPKRVLVHMYRRHREMLARLDDDEPGDEAQPDLILFRAALERLRQNLVGIFVTLEDELLWRAHWGDLVEYRGGQKWERPAPREAPAFIAEPGLLEAWNYTLNLNSITSPSLTT